MKSFSRRSAGKAVWIFVAVIVGVVIGAGADHLAFAQQPGITRTVLLRSAFPPDPNYEAVVGIAEIPPGGNSGKHSHHGIEVGYVLEGTLGITHVGHPTESYTAGHAFKDEGGVHEAKNIGKGTAKVIAVYVVEKGKPLAEPAP